MVEICDMGRPLLPYQYPRNNNDAYCCYNGDRTKKMSPSYGVNVAAFNNSPSTARPSTVSVSPPMASSSTKPLMSRSRR